MASLIPGLIVIAAVLLFITTGSSSLLLQPHALIIVFGGTLGVFLLSNSLKVILGTIKSLVTLWSPEMSLPHVREDLIQAAKSRQFTLNSGNTFLQYARDLWEQGVEPELFVVLLSQKRAEIDQTSADAIQALKNLAKYPPALGMIGTVVGMLHLFNNLSNQKDMIGANLALAMTATFFGLTLTNLLISPLADRLQIKRLSQRRVLDTCYEILLLINRNDPAALVEDEVRQRGA